MGVKPFLDQVAKAYYDHYQNNISKCAFIFPNRRAGLFFQQYLAQYIGTPILAPAILTINDLFASLSPILTADRTDLIFALYQHYIALSGSDESFDKFLFWGEMLLNDFDEVDKQMVDAKQLFTNIKDLREIDEKFSYLSSKQLEAIRQFWSNFLFDNLSPDKASFVAIWEILYPLYTQLRNEFESKGLAYDGMIFRSVAENINATDLNNLPYIQVAFVGFNAITKAEVKLFDAFNKSGLGDFYWDYQSLLVSNRYNKSAYFKARNLTFKSKLILDNNAIPLEASIEVIGIPSGVGQAKQTQTILQTLIDEGVINPRQATNTAIVLPKEQLLLPLLHSIPGEIDPINVTMGITLATTPIAGFVSMLVELQQNIRYFEGEPKLWYKMVTPLLAHPYTMLQSGSHATKLKRHIAQYNRIFLTSKELSTDPFLSLIFTVVSSTQEAIDYLKAIVNHLLLNKPILGEALSEIDREFFYHYQSTIFRIESLIQERNMILNVETLFRLIEQITLNRSIPFSGEPLSGLQIMGILETRALDFENIIVLSLNDDIFPGKHLTNTFVPYNLRKGFEMTTNEYQDAIAAYNFYRMIGRAKRLFFLYDTRTEDLNSGQISRYLYQLKYHFRTPINEQIITYDIKTNNSESISISKTPHLVQQLKRYVEGGDKALSASSLNTYLNCPLQFYLNHVEKIDEEDEVNETVDSANFGTIYHEVMENLYQPFTGKEISAITLKSLRKEKQYIEKLVSNSFAKNFFKSDIPQPIVGQNRIIAQVIMRYIDETLRYDTSITPFIYIQSEENILINLPIEKDLSIRFTAKIDRVDQQGETIRIADYKTGKADLEFRNIPQLFDTNDPKRPKAVMQVFLYALIYTKKHATALSLKPVIYVLKGVANSKFDVAITHKDRERTEVNNFDNYRVEFEKELRQVVKNIFDPTIPFEQTPHIEHCKFCTFSHLCKR